MQSRGAMRERERQELLRDLDRKYRTYFAAHLWWTIWHHTTVFVTPFVAFVTTLLALSGAPQAWSVAGAALVTFLSTLGAVGGFGAKWRNARRSRSVLEQLRIRAKSPDADLASIRSALERAIEEQDAGVVAAEEVRNKLDALDVEAWERSDHG